MPVSIATSAGRSVMNRAYTCSSRGSTFVSETSCSGLESAAVAAAGRTSTARATANANAAGFGRLTIEAVQQRDYTLIQGVVLVSAVGYVVINLLVDIVYSLLNPRIRVAGGRT